MCNRPRMTKAKATAPSKLRIMLVGGGARSHALGEALLRSPSVGTILFAPGTSGLERRGFRTLPVASQDFLGLAEPGQSSAPMDPEVRQRQFLRIIGRLIELRDYLEIGLLEDLHWMDPASQALNSNPSCPESKAAVAKRVVRSMFWVRGELGDGPQP